MATPDLGLGELLLRLREGVRAEIPSVLRCANCGGHSEGEPWYYEEEDPLCPYCACPDLKRLR
jgi:hypothetical protein